MNRLTASAPQEMPVDLGRRECPACAGTEHRSIGAKNEFALACCRSCKTLYTQRLPSWRELDEYYAAYYGDHNLDFPAFLRRRLSEIIAHFSPYRSLNRLLDIGCGSGGILREAKSQRWEAIGTEVSWPAIERARQAGLTVLQGDIADLSLADASFDVVACSEVIEHVPHPEQLVRDIKRVLRPGGLLWMTTPHGSGLSWHLLGLKWSIISPPEHLQLFSIGGMHSLLHTAGFRRITIQTRACNVLELAARLREKLTSKAPESPPEAGTSRSIDDSSALAFDRVSAGYRLNELLLRSQAGRIFKGMANSLLNLCRAGDGLCVHAIRPT